MRDHKLVEVPVLVAGAGPTGLCAALLLARHGVESLTVERHPGTSIYPRATGINVRSMEVLRSLGLEATVRDASFDGTPNVARSSTLVDIDVELSASLGAQSGDISPCDWTPCSQRELEPILAAAVEAEPCAELRFGAELVSFKQDGSGVIAEVLDRAKHEVSQVRCEYLIAADGARSQIRDRLGIAMHGPGDLMPCVSVHFSSDLRRRLPKTPNFLHFVANDGVFGVFMPTDSHTRWVFALPQSDRIDQGLGTERAADLVRVGAGLGDLKVDVLGVVAWMMQADWADQWRAGNVFLAGDAAHRMTPAGGLGMNTGIQDVHNLCWKLAAVLQGSAGLSLLDTYAVERKPVAQRNVQRSVALISAPENAEAPALEVDLGFVYASAAVIPDEPAPNALAGARAPHAWLGDGVERTSTLDMFGPHWTLVTGPRGEEWVRVARRTEISLKHRIVAPAVCDRYGIQADGAVLVRPDGHVAWRQPGAMSCPSQALGMAIDRLLASNGLDGSGRSVPKTGSRS